MSAAAKNTLFFILILFLSKTSEAQLCTGSLGDPVVNITFGSGGNPGPPLPAAVTSYSYFVGCPQDGLYSIVSSTPGCFSNTWHILSEDHTPGDVNGYMMLVNASFNPGVFYLDTVKNLCGGTTYEFSAWIMSVLRSSACSGSGIRPNITFSIETPTGTVVGTYNTGNIDNLSSPQWSQYGFYFTLPTGVSDLVLRMTNNSPGGCGNDLALDDISFRPCGPKVNAAFANLNGITDTAHYCITDNKNITIDGNVQSGYNNPAFQWQQSTDSGSSWHDIPGEATNTYTHTYTSAGVFQYRLTAAELGNINIARCRVSSNTLTIAIDAIPDPQAANSSPVCDHLPVTLMAKNGNAYAWTGPNGFAAATASPVIATASVADAGIYNVVVSTKGGCAKQGSTTVVVNSLPAADAGADAVICESTSTALQASGGIRYVWSPSVGLSDTSIANPVASPAISTHYAVSVFSAFNCKATDSVLITVLKKPVANAGPDKRLVAGATVQLSGIAGGDTASHFWTPAQFITNTAVLNPFVSPPADLIYTLHVQSGNGCGSATDDVFVRVFQKITLPNAFSPNGDGINDRWDIGALNTYPEADVRVFNRFGQVVYKSQGYAVPWNGTFNGKPIPVGTYYYTIDRKNGFPLMSGWVMVIR